MRKICKLKDYIAVFATRKGGWKKILWMRKKRKNVLWCSSLLSRLRRDDDNDAMAYQCFMAYKIEEIEFSDKPETGGK